MRFKNYEWKFNPSKCIYTCEKSIVKHKYPELNACELEDMDSNGAVISGVGELFGPEAYDEWLKLVAVFKQNGIGPFYHPIYKDVTMAAFKKLEATVEPVRNYVSYSFEFWEHKTALPTVLPSNNKYKNIYGDGKANTVTDNNRKQSAVKVATSDKKHVVKAGDTLSAIGKTYGVNWKDIAKFNNIKNPNLIRVGQVIKIP